MSHGMHGCRKKGRACRGTLTSRSGVPPLRSFPRAAASAASSCSAVSNAPTLYSAMSCLGPQRATTSAAGAMGSASCSTCSVQRRQQRLQLLGTGMCCHLGEAARPGPVVVAGATCAAPAQLQWSKRVPCRPKLTKESLAKDEGGIRKP